MFSILLFILRIISITFNSFHQSQWGDKMSKLKLLCQKSLSNRWNLVQKIGSCIIWPPIFWNYFKRFYEAVWEMGCRFSSYITQLVYKHHPECQWQCYSLTVGADLIGSSGIVKKSTLGPAVLKLKLLFGYHCSEPVKWYIHRSTNTGAWWEPVYTSGLVRIWSISNSVIHQEAP